MGLARDLARLRATGGGQLADAYLASLTASKLSGQLPDANAPSGSVIQVVQATFTGTQTITASGYSNWTDVTNLSLNITPISSSNKVLLMAQITVMSIADRIINARFSGGNAGNYVANLAGSRARAGAFIVTPSSGGGAAGTISMNYLDSPATTSSITYKVQVAPNFSSGDVGINYNLLNDADVAYITRGACSLLALEIAA